MKKTLLILIIFLIPLAMALSGNSSSYTSTNKMDFGGTSNVNSTTYDGRFISGEQPVSQYNSTTYDGRLGVLEDTTAPVVTLISPADGTSTTSTSTTFQYSVVDDSVTNCSLIRGGVVKSTNLSVNVTGGTTSFMETLSVGSYTWSISCVDLDNNAGNSSTRNLTILSLPTGGGTGAVTAPVAGGGGGGAGGAQIDFKLGSYSYETTLSVSDSEYASIQLTNTEKEVRTFTIENNLDEIVFLDQEIIALGPKQSTQIGFTIIAPNTPGLYPGKIVVSTGGIIKEILISINVNTQDTLFDLSVVVPARLKTIKPGENLEAQIDMLQAALKEEMDVKLDYVIKDFNGNVYLQEGESIMVYDQKTITKEFYTAEFPEGDYVLGIELTYPGGVAVASSQFKISSEIKIKTEQIILVSLIIGILIVFISIWFSIKRYKSKKIHR